MLLWFFARTYYTTTYLKKTMVHYCPKTIE